MKDWGADESLSEGISIDQELVQALAVDPSPEFLARVRSAVGEAPAHGRWSGPWLWTGLGSAAVAMIVTGVLVRVPPPKLPQLPGPPIVTATSVHASSAEWPLLQPAQPARERHAPAPRPADSSPGGRDRPEVLIAQDEAAALRRLMHGWRQVAVADQTVARLPDGTQALELPAIVVSPISAITPIVIEPLGLEEGREQ